MTLTECLDSPVLGWITGVLAFGMLIWYVIIARKWWEAAENSSDEARTAWRWMVAIFIICAVAGYVSWDLALFAPKVAVVVRITALAAQNIACPIFMTYAMRVQFYGFGTEQAIGHQILANKNRLMGMTNDEKAEFLMQSIQGQAERIMASVEKLND